MYFQAQRRQWQFQQLERLRDGYAVDEHTTWNKGGYGRIISVTTVCGQIYTAIRDAQCVSDCIADYSGPQAGCLRHLGISADTLTLTVFDVIEPLSTLPSGGE